MILTYILTAALMLLSLVVQGSPSFDVIRVAGVKPDLIFIFIVYLSYSFGSFFGEVSAFSIGLLQDAVSQSPLGFLTLPKVIVAFVLGRFGRSIIKSNILTVFLLVFLASLVKGILTLFFAYIFHPVAISTILSIILPESFYNAILAPLLFVLFDKLFEKELEKER